MWEDYICKEKKVEEVLPAFKTALIKLGDYIKKSAEEDGLQPPEIT